MAGVHTHGIESPPVPWEAHVSGQNFSCWARFPPSRALFGGGVLGTVHPTKEDGETPFDVGMVGEGIALTGQPASSWVPFLWQRSR